MGDRERRWRRVAVPVLLVVLGAGCASGGVDFAAGGGDDSAGQTTTTFPDQTTTTGPDPTGPRPDEGECRAGMTFEEINAATDPRPPIDCDEPHGTETIDVIGIPEDTDYEALVDDIAASPEIEDAVEECQSSFESYVELELRETSAGTNYIDSIQLTASWYIPSEEEWDEGARWLRCDATLLPAQAAPDDARPTADVSFESAHDEPVEAALRECAADPIAANTDPVGDVACSEPHYAEHLVDVLDGDTPFPTGPQDAEWRDTVIEATRDRCGDALSAAIGAPRTDLRGHVNLPSPADALAQAENLGYLAYSCWVISETPITGTVFGIESGPLPDD